MQFLFLVSGFDLGFKRLVLGDRDLKCLSLLLKQSKETLELSLVLLLVLGGLLHLLLHHVVTLLQFNGHL